MANITFSSPAVTPGLLENLKPLMLAHWDEIALYKELVNLDPNFRKYLELAEIGAIKVVVAKNENEYVGYASFIITQALHYSDLIVAEADVFYMRPEYRGYNSIRLFKAAEFVLEDRGIDLITLRTKVHKDLSVLFERLGYDMTEKIYSKLLR